MPMKQYPTHKNDRPPFFHTLDHCLFLSNESPGGCADEAATVSVSLGDTQAALPGRHVIQNLMNYARSLEAFPWVNGRKLLINRN